MFLQRFGTSFTEITYEQIEQYFSIPREENLNFECKSFKSFEGQLQELQIEIVGFKNSDGGILIYGGPRNINHTEQLQQQLVPITDKLNERNILDKLISQIEPFCSGIQERLIQKIGEEKWILAILIDKTTSTAFMVKEKGFYFRTSRKARPAPHYFVEALMKRVTYPDCTTNLTITHTRDYELQIKLEVFNNSRHEHIRSFRVVPSIDSNKLEISISPDSFGPEKLEAFVKRIYSFSCWVPPELRGNRNRLESETAVLSLYLTGENIPMRVCRYEIFSKPPLYKSVGLNVIFQNKNLWELGEEEIHKPH